MRLEIRIVRREMGGFMIDLNSSIKSEKESSLLLIGVRLLLGGR